MPEPDQRRRSDLLLVCLIGSIFLVWLTVEFAPSARAKEWVGFAANIATMLGAAGVLVAALAYWRGEQRAAESDRAAQKLRVHELFQAYLTMRFEASLAAPTPHPSHTAGLSEASDNVEGQLAGSKLYALEEMLARVKRYGHAAPDQDWMAYSDPEYGPWIATLLTHLGQKPDEVTKSLIVYRECYTVDLIELAARYLNDPELQKVAESERELQNAGQRKPPSLKDARDRIGRFK